MNKLWRIVVVCALLLTLASPEAQGQAVLTLFSIDQGSDQLRVIDPATAQTVSSVTITLAGQTVLGSNGLALHPVTGQLWAILRLQGQVGRQLVILDATTGVATSVGNTGDAFAGLAFDCGGTLYGITGDGATIPSSVFVLNQTTGAPTLLTRLGKGDDGEAIGFNPLDNLLYHGSGISGAYTTSGNTGVIFESFDPTRPPIRTIPLTGNVNTAEVQAMVLDTNTGNFLWKQANSPNQPLFSVAPAGASVQIGIVDHQAKGFAFSGGILYSVASLDALLRTLNPANGATLTSTAITLAGQTVLGATGLAAQPGTGQLFATLILQGVVGPRELVTINPATGVATSIGTINAGVSGLAFDAAGNLYALFGNSSPFGPALFQVNPATAAVTFLYPLPRGGIPGRAMAFNPNDGLLYHAAGNSPANMVFEAIDVPALPLDIPISGALVANEAMALTFEASSSQFLWKQGFTGDPLFRVATNGSFAQVGALGMDHISKGLSYAGPGASACPAATADLSVIKVDTPDPVIVGANLTYDITVTNNGPNDATSVVLTDPLPANTAFVSATAGTCNFAAGTITCNLGTVNNGANVAVQIVVSPTAAAVISNTATVSSATPDPNNANNSATVTTTANAASADVSVTKTDAPDPVAAGNNVTYTINVTNAGPQPAAAVTLTDPLPGTMTFVSVATTVGVCNQAGGTVTCNLGTLNPAAAATITIVATATAVGTPSNTATASSTTADPSNANNSSTATTTVTAAAATDFFLTGTPQVLSIPAGQPGSFTFTATPTPAGSSFNQVITFTCMVDPLVGTCAAAPGSGTPGVNPLNTTITVTPAAISAVPWNVPQSPLPFVWLVVALALATLLVTSGTLARQRGMRRLAYCAPAGLVLLVASLMIFQTSCATAGNRVTGPHTVTVTATAGAISHTATATFNVTRP